MALEALVYALVDGVFNDPDHRAQKVSAGEYLTVAGGWYVESLIESGLVAYADSALIKSSWYEGKNMEGVGPHIAANFPDRSTPVIDPAIIALANDLDDLDAAFAHVNQAPVPDPTPEPSAPVVPSGRIPESKVVPKRNLTPEARGGRRRG